MDSRFKAKTMIEAAIEEADRDGYAYNLLLTMKDGVRYEGPVIDYGPDWVYLDTLEEDYKALGLSLKNKTYINTSQVSAIGIVDFSHLANQTDISK